MPHDSQNSKSHDGITCGVLASGALGMSTLKHAAKCCTINFVFTDKASEPVIHFCEESQIPLFIGNPRNGRCTSFLESFSTDVILSVNYRFLVDSDVLEHPRIVAANFHGSLLPKYRGRTPHVWAIINGESETGVTAHSMDAGCDTGDILLQRRIPIEPTDTGANLLERFHLMYPDMIDDLLDVIASGTLVWHRQDHSRATYFGVRTPEDGRINWDWHKQRIYNWIRAQASPYPGAFFEYDGRRHTVNRSCVSDLGFDSRLPNGSVLSATPLVVKTANGALELLDHDFDATTLNCATQALPVLH